MSKPMKTIVIGTSLTEASDVVVRTGASPWLIHTYFPSPRLDRGATFQISGSDRDQEREVRERILDLLSYLESIQRKEEP